MGVNIDQGMKTKTQGKKFSYILIAEKCAKTVRWRDRTVSSTSSAKTTGPERMRLDLFIKSPIKNNHKWTMDLNKTNKNNNIKTKTNKQKNHSPNVK